MNKNVETTILRTLRNISNRHASDQWKPNISSSITNTRNDSPPIASTGRVYKNYYTNSDKLLWLLHHIPTPTTKIYNTVISMIGKTGEVAGESP